MLFELLMSVSIFVVLSQLRLIIWMKSELNPTFSSLKANLAVPEKKTIIFNGNFYNTGHANKATSETRVPQGTSKKHCDV